MKLKVEDELREKIVTRATQMAQSGEYARCIDIEAALLPYFGYQAMRADFRSSSFQDTIECICRETFKGDRSRFQ